MKENSLIYSSQVPERQGFKFGLRGRSWDFQRFGKWPEVIQLVAESQHPSRSSTVLVTGWLERHWKSGWAQEWGGGRAGTSSAAPPGRALEAELCVGDLMFIWGEWCRGRWWGARCQRALCSNLRTPPCWLVEKPLLFCRTRELPGWEVYQKGLIPKWHLVIRWGVGGDPVSLESCPASKDGISMLKKGSWCR